MEGGYCFGGTHHGTRQRASRRTQRGSRDGVRTEHTAPDSARLVARNAEAVTV
ncbi:hypothetical protein HSB1_22470 [Halogranum salarium B-1]|uniref:Uncharacterized protein n=1 Tax=Halogranum salarium B-1 TaxID=1210908 RepID=J3JF15_9EURY|nr:hypothetical protein HSB1_22470 [Halogranum salarium B-1]